MEVRIEPATAPLPLSGSARRLWRADWSVVAVILIVKVALFFFALAAYEILENERVTGMQSALQIWERWDVTRYQIIAETGYQTEGKPYLIAFFPLFPWLMRAVSALLHSSHLVSGFVIATAASVAAGVLLYRLARLEFPRAVSRRAVWFMFIFPTSYFLHIPYTESLFLALVIGSFLAARCGHWKTAGALGALASFTRVTGIVLLPALILEAFVEFRSTRRWQWRWLWSLAVALGFVAYLGLNYHEQGSPLAFLKYQQEKFDRTLTWPWEGLQNALGEMGTATARDAQMVGMQETLFALIGLAGTIGAWIKLRPGYAMWMTGNWLAMTCSSFVLSVPRYTLVLFPLFLLFAVLARDRTLEVVITLWSLLFLGLFTAMFVTGYWAF